MAGIRTIFGWTKNMREALVAAHGSEQYVEEMSNAWADANQKSLETFGKGPCAYEHLYKGIPKITAPTLILYGEKDPMMPIVHAHYYHQHIKNSL
jgi:pimeloyl-ACP methyl ester carboxylesterase